MRVCVIGADRGLGKILCKALSERGHDVIAGMYDLTKAEASDSSICFLQMDVTNEQELIRARDEIKNRFGKLDAVVDVAGILMNSDREFDLLTEPLEDVSKHMQVNAIGLLAAFRNMYPIMEKNSCFYAVTSEGGSFTLAGTLFPAYSISKTAANKVVQVLRLTLAEMEDNTVDLIAVHPGRMNTEMGRTTAQIEPETSAEGFIKLIEGTTKVDSSKNWFVDYLGNPMPV